MRNISILLFLISNICIKSQSNHFLGSGFGISVGSPANFDEKRYFLNFNYFYNYKFLVTESDFSISFETKFQNEFRLLQLIGFSTNLNKPISWHFLLGYGYITATNRNYVIYGTHGVEKYTYIDGGTPTVSTGFLFNPLKSKLPIVGIEANILGEKVSNGFTTLSAFPITYSINFKFKIYRKNDENN